jgi:NADH-quinone oxidoreductase subunit K
MFLRQLSVNFIILIFGLLGLTFNRRNFLIALMCIELILLSLNLNFLIFSIYLDDFYGQIFALFILTIAAAESAIGIALIIAYFRIKNNIFTDQKITLRY